MNIIILSGGNILADYLNVHMEPEAISAMSSLALAHIGDAVYDLLVRTRLSCEGRATSGNLHRETVLRVSARAQARAAASILPLLNEEESDVFRRGRNTKVHFIPKNATRAEYQQATALEALFGWLFLTARRDRIKVLFDVIVQAEVD
jgi:ribonuclease III family protein